MSSSAATSVSRQPIKEALRIAGERVSRDRVMEVRHPYTGELAGTVPKATAKYQDHPSGANMCGKCNYFLPGANAKGPGQCKLVAGPISPTGWCTLFAPKPQ